MQNRIYRPECMDYEFCAIHFTQLHIYVPFKIAKKTLYKYHIQEDIRDPDYEKYSKYLSLKIQCSIAL